MADFNLLGYISNSSEMSEDFIITHEFSDS